MYPTFFTLGILRSPASASWWRSARWLAFGYSAENWRRSGLPASASDAAMAGVFGGLVGAKLLWVVEHLGEEPFRDLLFSRGGMSWFGGLAGGVRYGAYRHAAAAARQSWPRLPPPRRRSRSVMRSVAIGCFLVGDDYGKPSDLPWAVAFPRGLPPTDVPVHPTQLYEMFALFIVAWLLIRWRRRSVPDGDRAGTLPDPRRRDPFRDRVHPGERRGSLVHSRSRTWCRWG